MNNLIKIISIFTLAPFWACQNVDEQPGQNEIVLNNIENIQELGITADVQEPSNKYFFTSSGDFRTQELDENADIWAEHDARCRELFLTPEDMQKILKRSEKVSDYDWYNRGLTDCGVDIELNIGGENFLFSYSVAGHGQLTPNPNLNANYDINDKRIVRFLYRKCDVNQEFFKWYIQAINWSPGSLDRAENPEETLRFLCKK